MQAIYYPMNKIEVDSTVDKYLKFVSNHDEYCLWFDVRKAEVNEIGQIAMPMPTAGLHTCVSRLRLGQINDAQRNTKYSTCLRKMLKEYLSLNIINNFHLYTKLFEIVSIDCLHSQCVVDPLQECGSF